MSSTPPDPLAGCNVAVITGEVATEPDRRQLPSGDVLVAFDVRVRIADRPTQSLPVSWIGPESTSVPAPKMGSICLVVGNVHRRFFHRNGLLQSRIDVRASKVVTGGPAVRRRAIQRFLAAEGVDPA